MRIVGIVFIVIGLILCLTIIGIVPGILMMLVGGVLVAVGGRNKVVIHNTVTVANSAPEARPYQAQYQPETQAPIVQTVLPQGLAHPVLAAPIETYDKKKWQTLVRYDDDLREAAEKVKVFGPVWEDELAEEYLKINDKTYLAKIVERIVRDATRGSWWAAPSILIGCSGSLGACP